VNLKLTIIGKDYCIVNEDNLKDPEILSKEKIHLIKLNFHRPTKESIEAAVSLFPNTNRYVIESNGNIRLYNDTFKILGKKFYVENSKLAKLISFLRKNNKILLNITNLSTPEKQFILSPGVLPDLLWNCEVVQISKLDYDKVSDAFSSWNGNLVII
jgi:hypothetical protein